MVAYFGQRGEIILPKREGKIYAFHVEGIVVWRKPPGYIPVECASYTWWTYLRWKRMTDATFSNSEKWRSELRHKRSNGLLEDSLIDRLHRHMIASEWTVAWGASCNFISSHCALIKSLCLIHHQRRSNNGKDSFDSSLFITSRALPIRFIPFARRGCLTS